MTKAAKTRHPHKSLKTVLGRFSVHPQLNPESNWRAVLAAALCGVAVAMNIGKVPITMTELRAEFGLSPVAAGFLPMPERQLFQPRRDVLKALARRNAVILQIGDAVDAVLDQIHQGFLLALGESKVHESLSQ